MLVNIHTDGGTRVSNPGPSAYGAVLSTREGVTEINGWLGHMTNNEAEYHALIFALRRAKEMGATRVQCYADSMLVVNHLNWLWNVSEKLQPLFDLAMALTWNFKEGFSITHVPREQNQHADRLVNEVLDAYKKDHPETYLSKERIQLG